MLMYQFFQHYYSFEGIIFTHSPVIVDFCKSHNVTVVQDYLKNPYNLPYIRDLYQQAFHLKRGEYYGYINSDIVMSPAIFPLLREIKHSSTIPKIVSLLNCIQCSMKLPDGFWTFDILV